MQRGSLTRVSRKQGPDVWQFRWSERDLNRRRIYRKRVLGSVGRYADEAAARCAVTVFLAEINSEKVRMSSLSLTVAQLCDHFEQRELAKDNAWRSHATKKIYKAYLTRWILPHWRKYELAEVRTIQVESWLRTLPLAKTSCAKIRNLMSVLFNHARRYELFDRNPICLVRQSAKRRTAPTILTPAEIKALLDVLDFRERALVFLAVYRPAPKRAVRFEMERCGFRRRDHERDTLNRIRSCWPVQDRILAKTCAHSSAPVRNTRAMEKALPLQQAR